MKYVGEMLLSLKPRELYREVCALLFFRHGIPPTANRLYQLVKRGSMSTPTQVLGEFWAELREKSRVCIDHPDLPADLGAAAGEAARRADRKDDDQRRASETMRAQLGDARHQTGVLQGRLAAVQAENARLQTEVTTLREAETRARADRQSAVPAPVRKTSRSTRSSRVVPTASPARHREMGCMADIYLLTGRTLPQGVAHESLPGTVTRFVSDCWPGRSRTPMMGRAKRRGLRLSLRATAPCPSGETGVFELRLSDGAGECLLLARLQRIGKRSNVHRQSGRTDVSRPPPRDSRQISLF
ncbi:plasmid replication DNA-binding protein KfrA [Paraburkholderia sp. BL6669N2]|nr:DNA-binding protein [Paraburkholderia sp. BL6669N2]REG48433.1 plasmid replication DNA-binding protein KfrA [Paraburkholderia sp. BL6669N2]